MATIDKKELWVGWTHDATSVIVPLDLDGEPNDIADEIADVACAYADAMLEEYERRFDRTGSAVGRRRKRKKDDDDEGED